VKSIIYLSSFLFSKETVSNPNIYPYNVFADKVEKSLFFRPITVLYGNNASGKSTVLNIMANKLQIEGQEYATSSQYGIVPYFTKFVDECSYTLGEDEDGRQIGRLPRRSRYIKSEDILYEIKKIQAESFRELPQIYEVVLLCV
jgi:hypothetical protein